MEIGCTPGLTSPRVATDCCSFFIKIFLYVGPSPSNTGLMGDALLRVHLENTKTGVLGKAMR